MKRYENCNFLDPEALRFASYCDWILSIFGEDSAPDQKLVFIFIDAFGWCFYDRYKGSIELLGRIQSDGVVEQAYAQFPSTTACHLTTIHFGLPVAKSGIYEWHYYEPLADGVIAPLLFSWAGDKEREVLLKEGFSPEQIFPFSSFYQLLKKRGVPSYIFQSKDYCPSSFSNQAFMGAEVVTYASEREGMESLTRAVKNHQGKGYFFLYLDSVDAASHRAGPHSLEAENAIATLFSDLAEFFVNPLKGQRNVKMVIGADHGQTEVNPATTYYLDKKIPESIEWFRTNKSGAPLVGGGSMRDMFLYLKPEYKARAIEILRNSVGHIADICDAHELVEQGYFGEPSTVTSRLTDRLAEVVIIPYSGESVWWSGGGRFENPYLGSHGGLTPEEIQIPRLVLDL